MVSIIEDLGLPREKVEKKFSELKKKFVYYDTPIGGNDELLERCKGAEIVTLVRQKMSADVINQLKNLRMIAVSFTAYNHIDIEAARKNGVTVCNVPEYAADAVAELVFGFMVALYRRLLKGDSIVREEKVYDLGGKRPEMKGRTLAGKTLGIVGVGNIGRRVAKIGKSFQMDILAHDVVKRLEDVDYVSLPDLLKRSDIVTVHTPLTDKTSGLLGREEINMMKQDAVLINASPAPLVEREALIAAIRNEKLQVALDWGIPADLPDDVLKSERVIFSPHVGYYTEESLEKRLATTVENIKRFINGSPINVVT
jgi:D-3-phosphoglycerate dehydrogenase